VLVVDTGGTSFDASLIHGGQVAYTREKWFGHRWYGHMTGLPAVDTRSIGAGGGSIARVDAAGMIHVGPESAGAEPGPAAYGRGGTEPTVTDAAVVLGYIDPDDFLGGHMRLDAKAARRAVASRLAEPLGIGVEQAAASVLAIVSESMRGLLTDLTVAQGRDARECLMVAGGGAAGLNIVHIAREAGIRTLIVPKLAAGLSAVRQPVWAASRPRWIRQRTCSAVAVNSTRQRITSTPASHCDGPDSLVRRTAPSMK
jgi:N-methylhydantoinase A